MQDAQLLYSPWTGQQLPPGFFAIDAREHSPGKPWVFDPWTGLVRAPAHIEADPEGVTIVPAPVRIYDAAALQRLAYDLLDPEMHGHAVTKEIRNQARRALGIDSLE